MTDRPVSPEAAPCERPPLGWLCTRGANHDGPCAAIPCDCDGVGMCSGHIHRMLAAHPMGTDGTAPVTEDTTMSTQQTMPRRVPPPGSWLAGALGCLCPVMDNAHGRGCLGGVRDGWGHVLYVVSGACPLHGGAHDTAYLPLAACAQPRPARGETPTPAVSNGLDGHGTIA